MTSEVAVMNREAIALAADSAVTFRVEMGQKIFTSASKIFLLSKYQPVAAMFYGNATLMEIPWETIIKIYRNRLGKKAFKNVGEYAQDLLSFLSEEEQLVSDEQQELYIMSCIYVYYFQSIKSEITERVEREIEEKGRVDETTVQELTSQIVKGHFDKWKDAEAASTVPAGFADSFRRKYRNLISDAKKSAFEELPLTRGSSRQLTEIAVNLLMKFPTGLLAPTYSGIVIAGFGTEDIFPVLESFSVEGRIDNFLKHKRDKERCAKITISTSAAIVPFAQSEMVYTFMEGVDPGYQALIDEYMGQICDSYPQVLLDHIDGLEGDSVKDLKERLEVIGKSVYHEYRQKFLEYGKRNYVNPVMSVVQALPRDELAAMAESLINLTSFKRRVSMDDETVGGPIDVAVISKGDGFIWIKRKHYFEGELNHHFFANYYREGESDDTKTAGKADSESIPLNEGI